MKILYHHRTRAEDAQGIHIEEIQRAFRQIGHEVRECALIVRGDGAQKAAKANPMVRAVSALAAKLPKSGYEIAEIGSNLVEAARVAAAVREWKPDLIYERYSLHNAAGLLASRWTGVPIVLEVNAPLAKERAAHGGLAFPGLAKQVEAGIWKGATAVVTVSTPLADEIVAAGVPRERILVLPNAIRREMVAQKRDGSKIRAKLGLSPADVVCGFTGWFRPWHGLEGLLEAFADAKLADRGAKVMLVGDGQALPALKEIVARRNLGSSVIFPGAIGREEIADYVAAFDIALQPLATAYASPMKIFEYLAMGKPVVAAATPAIEEILTDGRDSILFPVGDSVAMVRAIESLVDDKPWRTGLSEGARGTIVRRGFFWDENARRTLEHVERVQTRSPQLQPVTG